MKNRFLVFIFISIFLCLISGQVLADTSFSLEVKYPEISGQTISSSTTLPSYIKYLFDFGMLFGLFAVFISITAAGVMYVLSSANVQTKQDASDRFYGAISGLLILIFTYLIVTTINPQLRFFSSAPLEPDEVEIEETEPAGVYFYNSEDCSEESSSTLTSTIENTPFTSSILDLGKLKNRVNSVKISNDTENEDYYMSILYSNPNLWGECFYMIASDTDCQSLDSFAAKASSASIHKYEADPDGEGVFFFHKPCFNKISDSSDAEDIGDLVDYCKQEDVGGGYKEITNSEIKNEDSDYLYVAELGSLFFSDVPELEKPCVGYDNDGLCTSREELSLAGENISSIIINGDYVVLFLYVKPGENSEGPWQSCQEFPKNNDTSKYGPQQIKWENIRNNRVSLGSASSSSNVGVLPDYVMIIPVKN